MSEPAVSVWTARPAPSPAERDAPQAAHTVELTGVLTPHRAQIITFWGLGRRRGDLRPNSRLRPKENQNTPAARLPDGVPPVDHISGTGHVLGRGAGEKHRKRADLVRFARPAHGNVLDELRNHIGTLLWGVLLY